MTEKSFNNFSDSISNFDENYKYISNRIEAAVMKSGRKTEDIIFLAATKTVDPQVINHAINSGIKYIGENRVQEFLSKDNDIIPVHRHFIGHLQTNKVKDIVSRVEMIESVHSIKLAEEIGKQALKIGKTMDILIEVNIGKEKSKSGFLPEETEAAVKSISKIDGVSIKGLMSIPPICYENQKIVSYFKQMNKLFIDISTKRLDNSSMMYLSMGMSDDFELAIDCGANIVRIGTALFGKRL
ncbi:MAG: YggS family pyridoxal phosphate-dependent enzyme [Oscillospiraceae bacterium]|nr:YggS family pyridoxal phosphate-dependent enzyme [Oscillospiraceae bacterium]